MVPLLERLDTIQKNIDEIFKIIADLNRTNQAQAVTIARLSKSNEALIKRLEKYKKPLKFQQLLPTTVKGEYETGNHAPNKITAYKI